MGIALTILVILLTATAIAYLSALVWDWMLADPEYSYRHWYLGRIALLAHSGLAISLAYGIVLTGIFAITQVVGL